MTKDEQIAEVNRQLDYGAGEFSLARTDSSFHQPISNDLHIFWASESAGPGEEIAVQGHFSIEAQLHLSVGDSSPYGQVTILSQAFGFIKAQLPDNLPLGVFQIWIQHDGSRSRSRFINRAVGDCFDSPDVYSGASVSIKGRDLVLPGRTPTIRFVSQNNGASLNAIYIPTGSNRFKLNFAAPFNLIVGTRYNVLISNGYGGSISETPVDDTLVAINSNPDTYQLGLAWSAYYTTTMTTNRYNVKTDSRLSTRAVGDGVVNDFAVIKGAMQQASSNGGGVVYLPAGTYKCEDSGFIGLDIPTNVVLQGAGKTSTILTYGTGPRVEKFTGSYQKLTIGICDLTMKCIDTSGVYAAGLFDQVKNVFFKNVRWELQKGAHLEIINSKKVAIIDCEFFQRDNANYHGPTTTTNCEYLTIKGTSLTFVTTGINTINSSKCFIEGNTLIRDMSIPMPAGSTVHLMTNDFMPKALVANNMFLLANGPIPRGANGLELNNDGETIISEGGGGVIPDLDYGQVTSATINTLTNTTKNWPITFNRKPVVAIIKGKGTGQVRKIVSRTNTTLTLDTAWDVIPDSTSSYSIFNWALEQVAFVNNEIRDQQRGIYMYHNAMHHVDIIENKLIDSGAINIEPIQQIRNNGVHQFIPVYNVEIVGNYVDGSTDPYNGVSIGVNSIQFGVFQSWGTICTNLRISRNTLIGAIPNKNVTQHWQFPTGYHAYTLLQASFYQDDGVPVILGTILCDNTAKNLKKAIFINSGSYHTSISRTIQINSPDLIENQILAGTNHGGIGIVTLK